MTAPYFAKRNSALDTSTEEYVAAAKKLCWHLAHGFTGKGVHRMPIAGDSTRLPFATGLSPLEKRLAWAQHFLARDMPGSQQIRQVMGHRQFGARVVYGDCIFFTVSPNEKHSLLTMRLSRFRANDPYVIHSEENFRKLASRDYPLLELPENLEDLSFDLPEYDLRKAASARDPLAVVEAFRINILLRLSSALGVRMCPHCPRCNAFPLGCQDYFGCSMRPLGGVLGGMSALGGAVEHQNHGTPHFHAEGHVVCAYQYKTLAEIAVLLQKRLVSVDDIKKYNGWLHREDILAKDMYDLSKADVEDDWWHGYCAPEHSDLSGVPGYLLEQSASTLWSATTEQDKTMARLDAQKFRRAFLWDAQSVFSRVQHHVHRKTKKGYEPLKACLSKRKCQKGQCKADFPKTKLLSPRALVVCRNLARRMGLRVSGRRNSFGITVGARSCEWQSGTTPSFAVLFRSNSHTLPNYRVPLLPETHEDESCKSRSCREHVSNPKNLKAMSKLAQRAQREATGYYCGYTFKRQPVGQRFMKAAAESYSYMTTGLADKAPGQKWHRITHRVLTDFQHRSMLRPAAEEWNLASNSHKQDPTNAEFFRTYRSEIFPGYRLVERLKTEKKGHETRETRKRVPLDETSGPIKNFEDLYGYRGTHPDVHLLSPWEFLMHWEILAWKGEITGDKHNCLCFPPHEGEMQLDKHWYMRRRIPPIVPAPTDTPMPDKQCDAEERDKLFSLYLRPWTLSHEKACGEVPHIINLDVIPKPDAPRTRVRHKTPPGQGQRSYTASWRWYIRGNVVTQHAKRLIVQFMAACCGKSKTDQGLQAEEAVRERLRDLPPNSMSLQRVHDILVRMSSHTDEKASFGRRAPRASEDAAEQDLEEDFDKKALNQSSQIATAMRTTAQLWSKIDGVWQGSSVDTRHQSISAAPAANKTGMQRQQKIKKPNVAAYQKRAYAKWSDMKVEEWWKKVETQLPKPTDEQMRFLRRVVERCREEQQEMISENFTEPVRDCLFGLPGGGKSTCIKWLRDFFETCLQWEDGVQFQFLAAQNTMAALISGKTIHSWSKIPVNATDGG